MPGDAKLKSKPGTRGLVNLEESKIQEKGSRHRLRPAKAATSSSALSLGDCRILYSGPAQPDQRRGIQGGETKQIPAERTIWVLPTRTQITPAPDSGQNELSE